MGHSVGTHCTMGSCFLTLLLVSILSAAGEAQVQCPLDAGYPNGLTHLTNGLNVGSIAKFLCPTGEYAWPVISRTCQANGQWSIMRSSTGKKLTKISCKKMRCPEPRMFENGEYFPRGPYLVGANITFVCNDGYTPRGSLERTCRRNAKWSGETAVCDDGGDHCADPGVPPGAEKTGLRYDVEESVSYKCPNGLDLVGSAKRTCLESRRWSGTEVSCQYPYAFDLPEDVGQQFAGSLSGVLNTFEKKSAVGRTVNVKKDGILNVYLLLDASNSVGEDNFQISKKCAEELVNGLGAFDMKVQFGILSYATESNVTVYVHDPESNDIDYVLELIEKNLVYSKHRDKQGTNIKGALKTVLEMMAFQKLQYNDEEWNSIQHVIILLTDGKSNMGGRPVDMVKRIKEFLDITPKREDFLDIYAFGIGTEIDKVELSEIASQKEKEQHMFILEEAERIEQVFQEITKIKNYGEMCGLNDESLDADQSDESPDISTPKKHPWNVLINTPNSSPCFGSLISSRWVLSAAHCFKGFKPEQYKFQIGSKLYEGQRIEIHKCYNINRKSDRGIKEDYDYDVALVQLSEKVEFSKIARPICIPCTEPANRAMKNPSTATCNEHRNRLLSSNDILARFILKTSDKKALKEGKVKIKHNNLRDSCISTIKQWEKFKNITNLQDMVSPRQFCVEGEMSCKGESGGSLFVDLRKGRRFFQVGVLSFGIFNPCEKARRSQSHANARDFYVNVLEVLPFLQEHLSGELEFLPGIPDSGEVVCPA
ncbi:complement C2-like [Lithobates pipiens]